VVFYIQKNFTKKLDVELIKQKTHNNYLVF